MFQTGKLSFLVFYDRQNCWLKKWREPLEAYYQASEKDFFPNSILLKLLLKKKKKILKCKYTMLFFQKGKKRNAGNWQNVSFKKFKLKGDNE